MRAPNRISRFLAAATLTAAASCSAESQEEDLIWGPLKRISQMVAQNISTAQTKRKKCTTDARHNEMEASLFEMAFLACRDVDVNEKYNKECELPVGHNFLGDDAYLCHDPNELSCKVGYASDDIKNSLEIWCDHAEGIEYANIFCSRESLRPEDRFMNCQIAVHVDTSHQPEDPTVHTFECDEKNPSCAVMTDGQINGFFSNNPMLTRQFAASIETSSRDLFNFVGPHFSFTRTSTGDK